MMVANNFQTSFQNNVELNEINNADTQEGASGGSPPSSNKGALVIGLGVVSALFAILLLLCVVYCAVKRWRTKRR